MKIKQSKIQVFLLIFTYFILQKVKSSKIECSQNQISDFEDNMCYNEKKECRKYISSDGKQCYSKCTDDESIGYVQTFEDYKQCKICRDFIVEKNKSIECVTQCNKNEMVYVFGEADSFKTCVSQDVCQQKLISAKYPNVCSDSCISPEIQYNNKCVEKCPEGLYFNIKLNSCQESCDQFISSNNKFCVKKCDNIFEYAEIDNRCKKCQINEYLSYEKNGAGQCKSIQKSDDIREQMRITLNQVMQKNSNYYFQEIEILQKEINIYTAQIEDTLKDISNKENKTIQDQQQTHIEYSKVKNVNQEFFTKIKNRIFQKAMIIGTSELIIISQLEYPGYKFKTSFNSKDIKQGSTLSLLEKDYDEKIPKFSPQYLEISLLKNNIFCEQTKCKKYPPRYIITHLYSIYQRILSDNISQQFQMTHDIPSGQEPSRLQCLIYGSDGNFSRQQGEIKNNQITCKFEFSTALFYDENCEFVDKQNCIKKTETEEQNNQNQNKNNNENTIKDLKEDSVEDEEDELSSGAIAGIVIGIIVVLGIVTIGIIQIIRMRKVKSIQNIEETDKYESQNAKTISNNKVISQQ